MDQKIQELKEVSSVFVFLSEECGRLTVHLQRIEKLKPSFALTAHHEVESHWRRTGIPFYRFLPSVSVGRSTPAVSPREEKYACDVAFDEDISKKQVSNSTFSVNLVMAELRKAGIKICADGDRIDRKSVV